MPFGEAVEGVVEAFTGIGWRREHRAAAGWPGRVAGPHGENDSSRKPAGANASVAPMWSIEMMPPEVYWIIAVVCAARLGVYRVVHRIDEPARTGWVLSSRWRDDICGMR